ncbi:unnamed protein product [Thelazia callipaeda]|uniref:Fatty acid synthase n=1 Tax=Thelazia callipaeda TaxID=103827 RepID=A0A0N5D2U7_THECL|nr:unnamed protein product [Thelazia callipaeda]
MDSEFIAESVSEITTNINDMNNNLDIVTKKKSPKKKRLSQEVLNQRWDSGLLKYENTNDGLNKSLDDRNFKYSALTCIEESNRSSKNDMIDQIPSLLIDIQKNYHSILSTFDLLPITFRESYYQCCEAFKLISDNTEAENCAAITYAITMILINTGYITDRKIVVSGLNTFMMLAALKALTLPDACFAWKRVKSIIKENSFPINKVMSDQVHAVLLKLTIDFQKTTSIISIHKLRVSDVRSLIIAVLTDSKENWQFLNNRTEAYIEYANSTIHHGSTKYIHKSIDLLKFIAHINDRKSIKIYQGMEWESEKTDSLIYSRKSFNESKWKTLKIVINLEENTYLSSHVVQNHNILSAATLLLTIYKKLSEQKQQIFTNVNFLSPIIFTTNQKLIQFEIETTAMIREVIYSNRKCVTFESKRSSPENQHSSTVPSDDEVDNFDYELIKNRISKAISDKNAKFIFKNEFYAKMTLHNYEYDGIFRSVQTVITDGKGYGITLLKPNKYLDILLDGVMQSIVFTYIHKYDAPSVSLVPYHVAYLEITPRLTQRISDDFSDNGAIVACFRAKLNNGQLSGSFSFETDKANIVAQDITFYPIKIDDIPHEKLVISEIFMPSTSKSSKTDSESISKLMKDELAASESNKFYQSSTSFCEDQKLVHIKSMACRLPKNIHDPAELWDALMTGQIMASKIPCSRIKSRDNLAGDKYGNSVRCANFLVQDISQFDAEFFGISRSEAEKMDPQQRLLLECTYECMENAGLTSLQETGFFIGFMANEYPDIKKSQDIISMLGSSASVISGRLNYLFGSTAPAITIDTACSSSLVALQTAIHAMQAGHCKMAVVAGVNLILTEESIGQRANGKILADDGKCRSFDSLSSGYGRADGCVVLLLSIDKDLQKCSNATYEVSIVSSSIGHNGQSASLTAPNGASQANLLRDCLNKVPKSKLTQPINYWEAHGTGTVIGDAIELKSLQSNLSQCLIGTIKTKLGHSEAAAGVSGIAKILLQFQHGYIPEHGSYQFLSNFQDGNLYLPIIGEEWNGILSGLSSFGISGTNAMVIFHSYKKMKHKVPKNLHIKCQTYICPISAKNAYSLNMLMTEYNIMLSNTCHPMNEICAAAALHRIHFKHRDVIFIHRNKIIDYKSEIAKNIAGIGLNLSSVTCQHALFTFYSNFPKFRINFKKYFQILRSFLKQKNSIIFRKLQNIIILSGLLATIMFLKNIGININVINPQDQLSLTAAYLITGKLQFNQFNTSELPITFSDIHILTQQSSMTNRHDKNFLWYSLYSTKSKPSGRNFAEYELMKIIAVCYLRGNNINWTYLYEWPQERVILPNYQFKRESYWITNEPLQVIDDPLIGRLVERNEKKVIFENQISTLISSKLINFTFDGQIRLSFGVCCEALIQALRLSFSLNYDTESRLHYVLQDITMARYILQENDWIKTTVKKYEDERYSVAIRCDSKIICQAIIYSKKDTKTVRELLNVKEMGEFISKANFYSLLKENGLYYKGIYNTITRTSNDEQIFVAKNCSEIFLAIESLIQVACFHNILHPRGIYEKPKFRMKYLVVNVFQFETMYILVQRSRIILYNEKGIEIISGTFESKVDNDKQEKRNQKDNRAVENNLKSDQDVGQFSNTYQEYMCKIRRAVDDIRRSSTTVNDDQLTVPFTKLGLDSLAMTDLTNRLNTVYFPDQQIGVVDLFNYPNIYALTNAIHSRKISSTRVNIDQKNQIKISNSEKNASTKKKTNNDQNNRESSISDQISTSSEEENCAYSQVFLNEQSKNHYFTLIITDQRKKSKSRNIMLIDIKDQNPNFSHKNDSSILYFNHEDLQQLKHRFSQHLLGRQTVMIKFEFSDNFPLQQLMQILLLLTEIINKSQSTFIFCSESDLGKINAFALGYAKSLCAELYPKVRYEWNFILQKMKKLRSYGLKFDSSIADNNSEQNWIITGGLGGIGWQMAKFLAFNQKVSHIILLSRREPTERQYHQMNKIRVTVNVDIRAFSVDISSYTQMKQFFGNLKLLITGIVHSAGCIHDALAIKQSLSTLQLATKAKCYGLLILEKFSRSHPIKRFIVNSSISALIGNRGQCNYSAANAFIDEFMLEKRKVTGLPATVINWGNWLETGMAVQANSNLNRMGFTGLKTAIAMKYFKYAIDYSPPRLIVCQLNINKISLYRPDLISIFALDNKNSSELITSNMKIQESQQWKLPTKTVLEGLSGNSSRNNDIPVNIFIIKSIIIKSMEEVIGRKFTVEDYQKSFIDLGFDSLKIYQLVNALTENIESIPSLNVLTIFENPTVEKLASYIHLQPYHIIKKNPQTIAKCSNDTQLEDGHITKNFNFFVLYWKDREVPENMKLYYAKLLDTPSGISRILVDQIKNARFCKYLQVIWGSKRKDVQKQILHSQIMNSAQKSAKPIISFMVSGQGSQVWNMGRQLSFIFPFFGKIFEQTLHTATKLMRNNSVKLRDIIYDWKYQKLLYKTEYAQAIIYCFAYSLAKLYEFCGVYADFYVGHSVGELVAYTLAGGLSLHNALKLVLQRGKMLESIRGKGKMIAVSKEIAEELENYSGLNRAAENSNQQVILSGSNLSIQRCLHYVQRKQYSATVIEDQYPFHSSVIDDYLVNQYKIACKFGKLQKAIKNIVRNSSGEFITSEAACIAPIRSPVLFKKCIETLNINNTKVWLEIGNGEVLSRFVQNTLKSSQNMLICSGIKDGKQEVDSFIDSLCQLQNFGIKIKWNRICKDANSKNNLELFFKESTAVFDIRNDKYMMELINEHLIYDQTTVPAALIIAIFINFAVNTRKTCTFDEEKQEKPSSKCHIVDNYKTILLEKLHLKKRVNERDLRNLQIKCCNCCELLLTDNVDEFCNCQLSIKTRGKDINQMEAIDILHEFHLKYNHHLLSTMTKFSHKIFYKTMQSAGLQYGAKYQVLRDIYRDQSNLVTAVLVNSADLTRLIDGALQLISVALMINSKCSLFIPFVIEKILIKYSNCDQWMRSISARKDGNRYQVYAIITNLTDNICTGSAIVCNNDETIITLYNVSAIDMNANQIIPKLNNPNFYSNSSLSSSTPSFNKYQQIDQGINPSNLEKENKLRNKISPSDTYVSNTEVNKSHNLSVQVVITSYAGLFPESAVDTETLWNNLKSGTNINCQENVCKFGRDISTFDPIYFGITPNEAIYMDPQQRILLELTQKTLQKAGLQKLHHNTGVFIGVSSNDFAQKAFRELPEDCSYLTTGTNQSVLAGRIAHWLNLTGPCLVIDTACSSFFSALTIAYDNIKLGRCCAALVGAVNIILNSKTTSVLDSAKMLSKTGSCKVFDADADGYVRSEAAAMILLQAMDKSNLETETLIESANDFTFTIENCAMNHKGYSSGLTVPSSSSEQDLMRKVTRENFEVINWVESHATGTSLGDPIEMEAIAETLGYPNQRIYTTSVKSSIAHCEAAAGAASLITVLESCRNSYLPSMQHFRLLNQNLKSDCANSLVLPIVGEELPDGTLNVLINSFGFSGINVSCVIRCQKNKYSRKKNLIVHGREAIALWNPRPILLWSDSNSKDLESSWKVLTDYLQTCQYNLAAICACLQDFRSNNKYRIAIPVKRHISKNILDQITETQPVKWKKILLIMNNMPEFAMISELCFTYRSYLRIFKECLKNVDAPVNNLISSRRKSKLEITAKLSLIIFLLNLGIQPTIVLATSKIDKITIAQLKKFKDYMKYSRYYDSTKSDQLYSFRIQEKAILDDFDCVINLQNLHIEKPKNLHTLHWKKSFSSQFAITICQLYEHFVDINWKFLYDRKFGMYIPIPDTICSKKRYWPFNSGTVNNKKVKNINDAKKKSPDRMLTSSLESQSETIREKKDELEENLVWSSEGNTWCSNSEMDSNPQYGIYRKLIMEWINDKENLLESSIKQSMIVIKLWTILMANQSEFNSNTRVIGKNVNQTSNLCLIVFTICKRDLQLDRFFGPCSSLLKTLAAESRNINFKSVLTDTLNERILADICTENNINETIWYRNGQKYLQRLQRINNHFESIIPQKKDRILITGNIKGIAGELIANLNPNLAIVVSRSLPDNSEYDKKCTEIKCIQTDCTDYQEMKKIFIKYAPFDVVFHCAAVISNALINDMTFEKFKSVCNPKLLGLQNLIKLSTIYDSKKIVAFSSAASIIGSVGQTNYAMANEVMEFMMEKDMPNGLVISWGPWEERGLLAGKHLRGIREQVRKTGWKLMNAKQVAQLCTKMLDCKGHYIVMDIDFDILQSKCFYLKNLLELLTSSDSQERTTFDNIQMKSLISAADEIAKYKFNVDSVIKHCIMEVSGITEINSDLGFMSMGIDSLMINEMQTSLKNKLKLHIPTAIFYEYCTVNTLTEYVMQNLPECDGTNISKIHDSFEANKDFVAISSYSGAFSGAINDQNFWNSLLNGEELIEIQSYKSDNGQKQISVGLVPDIDKFDYRFWKISFADACYIDPQIRKFVEHAYIALERSGLIQLRNKLRIGVVAGAEPSKYRPKSRHVGGIEGLYEMNQKDFVASWTSHLLNLHGPSFGIYSACSTALVAIIQGISLLQSNQCDAVLVGAVSLANPMQISNNNLIPHGMILSSDGHCRPFDQKSSGTVRGSAVGVVVLQRITDINQHNNYSVIIKVAGYGMSNDGLMKSSFMAPNISGQRACIKEANRMSGKSTVDYVECHGTGTTTGDLIELTAMSQIYPDNTLVGSVKANIGHALAASAIASIIKLCKIAETNIVPRQINFEAFNESLSDIAFQIPKCNVQFDRNKNLRLAVNSSGIGGTNAHIILEAVHKLQPENKSDVQKFYALTVTGKSEIACIKLCNRVMDYLVEGMNIAQIASTLQNYREHFEYRIAITARTISDAVNKLKNIEKVSKVEEFNDNNLVFYFPPQGLEYTNMGYEALKENDTFRQVMQKCCKIASSLTGENFEEIIYPKNKCEDQEVISKQPYSQMAMFMISYALVKQLQVWGIDANTLIGHSLGEYVAAAHSDVFDVETALSILCKRGQLIARTGRAKMLAIKTCNSLISRSEDHITNALELHAAVETASDFSETREDVINLNMIIENAGNLDVSEENAGNLDVSEENAGNIEVSAVLSKNLHCVVAKPGSIEELAEKLKTSEINCQELVTNYGFHTSFMDCILDEFAEYLKKFTFRKPSKQILSNIDGKPIQNFNCEYLVKHLRSTVRLDKCIENLPENVKVIVEIGPKGVLQSLLKNDQKKTLVLSALPSKKQHEKEAHNDNLLSIASKLWMKGYPINWEKICGNYGFDRFLPNYQFEEDICWESETQKVNIAAVNEINFYQPCWVPINFTSQSIWNSKGVLIFAPIIPNKSINELLVVLRNLFIPYFCVLNANLSSDSKYLYFNQTDSNTYISDLTEKSYKQLADILCDQNFHFDTIIHAWNFCIENACLYKEPTLLSSFYSIRWIIQNIVSTSNILRFLILIGQDSEAESYTALNPIRELIMMQNSVHCTSLLCKSEVNLFKALQLLESFQPDFSLIRNLVDDQYEYFSYFLKLFHNDSKLTQNCLIQNHDIIVIFGGFGRIGQSFLKVLCQNFKALNIYSSSPNATRHFLQLQDKIHEWQNGNNCDEHKIIANDVDISKYVEVRNLLQNIIAKYGRIDVIIHAAASRNHPNVFEKNFSQIESILQPKINGTRNVLKVLSENNIAIRSLILNSSMNALFGLPGNSDYAASNSFLDALCDQKFCNIQNITSIQWMGWKGSQMLEEYAIQTQNPVANLIMQNSILQDNAEELILNCLHERGLVAVSFVNPNEIIKEFRKLNFRNSEKKKLKKKDEEVNCNDLKNFISKIWMDCLAVENITDSDDFFQLGGHSLNGMQIIWEINRVTKINLKLDNLLKNSKFKDFLHYLQRINASENILRYQKLKTFSILDSSGEFVKIPLSYPQENMYILRHLYQPSLYNICFLLTFHGKLCTKSLRKAMLCLIARQTSLRTAFPTINITCYQEIYSLTESYYHISWPYRSESQLQKFIEDEKNQIFDLNQIPFRLLPMCIEKSSSNTDGNQFSIIINQHHISTDGWSMTVFANELTSFYHCFHEKKSIPESLGRLSQNLAHFAIWQRSQEFSERIQNDLHYLCEKFDGLQATRIITHETQISSNSKLIKRKVFVIPELLWSKIIRTAKQCQHTVYTIMLTAFLCLIQEFCTDYHQMHNIVIGCAVSGRSEAEEMKSVIGYFLNNIVLFVNDFQLNTSAKILFQKVAEAIQNARKFEHIPFHILVAKLNNQQRNLQQHPIFDIFFNYRHNLDFPKMEMANVESSISQLTNNNDAFNFACTIDETDQGTQISLDYNSRLYSNQLTDAIIRQYLKLLKSLTNENDKTLYASNMHIDSELPENSKKKSRLSVNYRQDLRSIISYQDLPMLKNLISIISQQCILSANYAALCKSHGNNISYREMYKLIEQFCKQIKQFYLQNIGESIRADTVIPICANSNTIILPLLAVQLTGAAYAPIDPVNTSNVIEQLVKHINGAIIIVDNDDLDLNIPVLSLSYLKIHSCNDTKTQSIDYCGNFSCSTRPCMNQNFDATYVIFTSGSTGKPKAVCVTNANLLNFVISATQEAAFRPELRIYHSVNTVFDVSCMNIFTTLSNGCCLVQSENILNAIQEIPEKLINFAFLPSALFNKFEEEEIVKLRTVESLFVGGETPNSQRINRLLQEGIRISQIYGPTETTIWSLSNKCSMWESETSRIIGKAINNEFVYSVNSGGKLACDGVKGELVISGEGVARGYINKHHSENDFTLNPLHTREDVILNRNALRCYYTGDLALKLDGKYHFLERKDAQLKIRGYRVEPAEIEATVRRWNSTIRNIIVLKNERLDNLVLFIENNSSCKGLHEYLKEQLLHYMIPKQIIVLKTIPLNRNGKIDQNILKRLLSRDQSEYHKCNELQIIEYSQNYSANHLEHCRNDSISENSQSMRTSIIMKIKKIWCQLLGISNLTSPNDDFFISGGHSLLLVLLRNHLLKKFAYDLNFENFYRKPTFSALVDSIHHACEEKTRKCDLQIKFQINRDITDQLISSSSHTIINEDKIDHVCEKNTHKCKSQKKLYFDRNIINQTITPIDYQTTSANNAQSNYQSYSLKFVNLRETACATGNLYLIHAIAGTIYPYFAIISAIPEYLNIYAIEYNLHYPSNTLLELATFYSENIDLHSNKVKQIHLMGHSMGGIIAREIAQIMNQKLKIPFVTMLDSWAIGTNELQFNDVKLYLQKKLEGLPNEEEYLMKAKQLTKILKYHHFTINPIKIYLLKAKNFGNSPITSTTSKLATKEEMKVILSNGWQMYSTKPIDLFFINGDHDSILQQHNLTFLTQLFSYIYTQHDLNNE